MKRILFVLLFVLISQIYAELQRVEDSAVEVDTEAEELEQTPHVLNVEDAYKPKKGGHHNKGKQHGMQHGKHKGKSPKTPMAVGASVGVGASCSGGVCQDKSTTACSGGSYRAGLCPGPSNVQCCQKTPGVGASCSGGTCQLTSTPCSGGSYHAGLCPGPSNVQCCVRSSAPAPVPGVGASCSGGTCQLTSTPCSGGSYRAGLCPGPSNVQCCVRSSAPAPVPGVGASCSGGTCQLTSTPCSGGSYRAGLCPGPSNVQCCVKSSAPAPVPGVGASCSGGTCQLTSTPCGGSYQAGLCPGPSNVQCCVKSSGGGGNGGGSSGVGASCPGGTCQLTSTPCNGGNYYAGACPGASNVQCCAKTSSSDARRQALINCGHALYNNRYSEHYSEGGNRWMGIQDHIMPPSAPTYSDCSSSVSWCYWTVFGSGPDILNGDNWQGGYTGTMAEHGTEIPCSAMQPGDIALYGSGYPWDHTEMYMGGGLMVSHGADPVSYEPSTSTQGFATMQCRSYF